MLKLIRNFTVAALLNIASGGLSFADGQYKLYHVGGEYIGVLELLDDVEDTRGVPYARLDLPDAKMMFYVDRDAVYVRLDPANPVFTQRRRYDGFWIGYATNEDEKWQDCPADFMRDHTGKEHKLYGNISWINTGFDDASVYVELNLGICDQPVGEWADNRPR